MKAFGIVLVTVIPLAALASGDDAAMLKAIHKRAQTCADTVVKGEFAKLADMTHPKVVEGLGGREKMIDKLQTEIAKMKDQGIIFRAAKADAPEKIFRSDAGWFSVVPTRLEVEFPKGKAKSKSFLLAVSTNQGKSWWFVDGNPGPERIRKLFPSLPKELKLPEKEPPVIEKNK